MKNFYEYRCPWCDEKTPPPAERYATRKRCGKCGNPYCFHWSAFQIVWEAAAVVFLIISIRLMIYFIVNENYLPAVIFPVLSFFAFPENYTAKPLKKFLQDGVNKFPEHSAAYKARFVIPQAGRYNFVDKAIFPVCFTDGGGQRISEYICVELSEVRRDKNGIECLISELSLGEKFPGDIPENSRLAIFVSEQIYFEGECCIKDQKGDKLQ